MLSSHSPISSISEDPEKLAPQQRAAGRFILATNVLPSTALSPDEMLSDYQGQQAVERGFRFLKDPMFLTDSVFLKSPQRIEALGLIMGLCLLVYSFGQRQLRSELQRKEAKVPNQFSIFEMGQARIVLSSEKWQFRPLFGFEKR